MSARLSVCAGRVREPRRNAEPIEMAFERKGTDSRGPSHLSDRVHFDAVGQMRSADLCGGGNAVLLPH